MTKKNCLFRGLSDFDLRHGDPWVIIGKLCFIIFVELLQVEIPNVLKHINNHIHNVI